MPNGIPGIDQIMKMIPGIVVTIIGGVATSVLPGKIKIAGLPVVGYGLYMMIDALKPKEGVYFSTEIEYPTTAAVGEMIHIRGWVINYTSTDQARTAQVQLWDNERDEMLYVDDKWAYIRDFLNPGAGGLFDFDFHMPNRTLNLSVQSGEYIEETDTFVKHDSKEIRIEATGVPSTRLIVEVADTQGNPIPDALVEISGPVNQQKNTECYPWPSCIVARAVFEDIPAGEYRVDVSHPNFESMSGYATVIENQDTTITFILRTVPITPVEIVHIASEDDRQPAQMIADAYGIEIVNDKGGIPPETDVTTVSDEVLFDAIGNILFDLRMYTAVATIGGQFANPLYEYAARYRGLRRLTGPGDWIVETISIANIDLVFIAGWTLEDTITAVNEFLGQAVGAEISGLIVNSI